MKHFALERYNLQGGRFHTLLTYSFSHMGFFSFGTPRPTQPSTRS